MANGKENNFSDEQLREGYWIVAHKERIVRFTRVAIIGAEIVLVIAIVAQLAGYGYDALTRQERIVQPLRALAEYQHPVVALLQPRIVSQGAIDRGTGMFDLYAILENPNASWRAYMNVVFTFNGTDLPAVQAYLLPNERKYVLSIGILGNASEAAQTRIDTVAWTRVDASENAMIQSAKGALRVADFEILSGRTEGGTIIPGTRVRFTIENSGVYNFSDIRIPVVIKRNDAPVAVAIVPALYLERNQKQTFEARWDYLFAGAEYDIVPDVDVLNPLQVRPAL